MNGTGLRRLSLKLSASVCSRSQSPCHTRRVTRLILCTWLRCSLLVLPLQRLRVTQSESLSLSETVQCTLSCTMFNKLTVKLRLILFVAWLGLRSKSVNLINASTHSKTHMYFLWTKRLTRTSRSARQPQHSHWTHLDNHPNRTSMIASSDSNIDWLARLRWEDLRYCKDGNCGNW